MQDNNLKTGKRPKNPLVKRVFKDLVRDKVRYLMVFAMLVVTVGFVSGMYVANNSMMTTLDENIEKLVREDGHFELSQTADEALKTLIESGEMADVPSVMRTRAYEEVEDKVIETVDEKTLSAVKENVEAIIYAQVEAEVGKQLSKAAAAGIKIPESERERTIKEAFDKAMSNEYDTAVAQAFQEAKNSDDYKNALQKALASAKEEIDKGIDDEYSEISERYSLDDEAFYPVKTKLYANFFKDDDESLNGRSIGKIRVFDERRDIDLYDLLDGRKPESDHEIMIDRMHADNANIKLNDILSIGDVDFKVVGLASFVDYTTLYENNTDTMFDALTFDVGMTTHEGFERLNSLIHYNYAFLYLKTPKDLYEEKEMSDNFMKALITQTAVSEPSVEIENYVPTYLNHAVQFAPDDMGSDKAMGGILLYILTAVLAFIFAVTISSTLEKESTVIGTLRALGYTRSELLLYYMSAPMIIVVIAAAIGNLLGYTVFKNVVTGMYYNSYSLPTYRTIPTPDAFVRTTVVPIIMMLVINLIIITKTLRLSPLRFLRNNIKNSRRQKAIKLPKWSFFKRFRMRVFIQNIPNYLMLFVGICFIMLLLSMAVGMPTTLKFYQDSVEDMMFAKDQIILMSTKDDDGVTITTNARDAEKFSITSLERRTDGANEEISIYGVSDNSRYITLEDSFSQETDSVYISKAYSEKYGVRVGDNITVSEKYENKDYVWYVYGIYDYTAGIAVFMTNDQFNSVFDKEEDSFSGYMSDEPITDIDKKYIAKEITAADVTKLANQLDHSMGSYMLYFQYVCVIIAAIIIYLLTKIIIEKNERSIAMTKILGYNDGEIASLYLITTGIVVLASELLAMYVGYKAMAIFWKEMMMSLGGWFSFEMTPKGFLTEFLLVFAAYAVIAVIDFLRIKSIPKIIALKNTE